MVKLTEGGFLSLMTSDDCWNHNVREVGNHFAQEVTLNGEEHGKVDSVCYLNQGFVRDQCRFKGDEEIGYFRTRVHQEGLVEQ